MATYTVGDADRVVPLEGVPQHSVGAPEPIVLSSDLTLAVAYQLEDEDGEAIALISFECVAPSYRVERHAGSSDTVLPRMTELLR